MRRVLFYVVTPLASVVVAVLLFEAALALFYPVPHVSGWSMYFEPDPFTGYRLKPNSVGRYQRGIMARTGSHGLRSDPIEIPRPAGTLRILVIGDSFTMGAGVEQSQAYPRVLEELLRSRCSPHIEVVNAGVGGWGPFQYAQYYRHYGSSLEPDLVLVGFFVGNDTFVKADSIEQVNTALSGKRVTRAAAQSQTIGLRLWLYEHMHLARLLTARGPVIRSVERTQCDAFPRSVLSFQRHRLPVHLRWSRASARRAGNGLAQLAGLRDDVARDRRRLVVALLPDENQVNRALQETLIAPEERDLYDFGQPQRFLGSRLAELGIESVDAMPRFLADDRCLYMNDTHWTPAGHELVAQALAEALAPTLSVCAGEAAPGPGARREPGRRQSPGSPIGAAKASATRASTSPPVRDSRKATRSSISPASSSSGTMRGSRFSLGTPPRS